MQRYEFLFKKSNHRHPFTQDYAAINDILLNSSTDDRLSLALAEDGRKDAFRRAEMLLYVVSGLLTRR